MRYRAPAGRHDDWLALLDVEGQFITVPILRAAFPSGLDAVPAELRAEVRARLGALASAPASEDARWAWIAWLLRTVLGWKDRMVDGARAAAIAYAVPEYRETIRADAVLIGEDGKPRAVVLRVPFGTPFGRRPAGSDWNASPFERAGLLARARGIRIALLTDGDAISLVWVPSEGIGGHATWKSDLFAEGAERAVFASFVSLLHSRRFFGAQADDQLERLFERSALAQQDLTKTLGLQVRRAVELLVAAFSAADRDAGYTLLADVPPHAAYEAAATVMMRLVFVLFAEERGLLPLSDPLYAASYALSTLRDQLDADAMRLGDEPLERRATAWRRLLAMFGAVHDGIAHDRLRMPAYGGRLFDPRRYAVLSRIRVDDLTVKAVLEAVQTIVLSARGTQTRRTLSFRTLDVEQIGHVYEGLLDHDAVRVDELYVGLDGKAGNEPEVPLSELEAAAERGDAALGAYLAEVTHRSESSIRKQLERGRAAARGDDPALRRLVMTACDSDEDVVARVLPFAALLRLDLHGLPTIFPPESLVVKQTRARRDSGTEYTPRALADEIVRYALEPLVYAGPLEGKPPEEWTLKPSAEILALRICDPACGSGAFLVAACRYLADRVAEAWAKEGRIAADDATREAQREIAERCLYGVDRDPMAVEMAKLSVWLLTFSRERPFGFLDHAIKEGDSLLGITSMEQLRELHLDSQRGMILHKGTLFDATRLLETFVDEAIELRGAIESAPSITVRDARDKAALHERAEQATRTARIIADALVGIGLQFANRPRSERDGALLELGDLVARVLSERNSSHVFDALESIERDAQRRLNAGRPPQAPPRNPLHWPLAFPEVVAAGGRGFDLIVGNPPFLGGKFITGRFGTDYRAFLVEHIANDRRGHADLVAYFFLRAAEIGKRVAMLATNTIAQGDTRHVGLDALVEDGWSIVRAERSRPWPGSASLEIAELWLAQNADRETKRLGGVRVPGISPLLLPVSRVSGNPFVLAENADLAFIGSFVLGMGFTMGPTEAQQLIAADPRNAEVLFPYINGDDVCNRSGPSASRWVINFFNWTEGRAQSYRALFQRVVDDVRPSRMRTKGSYKTYWWRFGRPCLELYRNIAGLQWVSVVPLVSKYVMPVKLPTTMVYSHTTAVIASDSFGVFGTISSDVHRAWARRYGSTMRTDTRYTPTDCFETFPRPPETAGVGDVMERLDAVRSRFMRDHALGMTATYNRYHDPTDRDPALTELRQLHRALDAAVIEAYGWTDIVVDHDFRVTGEGTRCAMSQNAVNEILDRLLELNHRRYAEERARGLHDKKRRANGRRTAGGNGNSAGTFFDEATTHV